MKIIHTADWHIGKKLYKADLSEDHRLFFDWLKELIRTEQVEVLLISGDIFDLANPSQSDRRLYFKLLSDLILEGTKVIITGGNHDSIGMLNGPKELLEATNIYVVGGAPDNQEDVIIELKDDSNVLQAIVLAIPYLRDRDLRRSIAGEVESDRVAAVRLGIRNYYAQLAEICKGRYNGSVPVIAMGHLYTHGASTSDSEREIQIGNEAGVSIADFPDSFDYLALGHIHRPQVIAKQEHIRYSGSPIALSFSEAKDQKSLVILEVTSSGLGEIRQVAIPKFRELKRFKGNLQEVSDKLSKYDPEFALPSFVEAVVEEEDYSPAIIADVQELAVKHGSKSFTVIKAPVSFRNGNRDADEIYEAGTAIKDFTPLQVFMRRLESENLDKKTTRMLISAFTELQDGLEESEK